MATDDVTEYPTQAVAAETSVSMSPEIVSSAELIGSPLLALPGEAPLRAEALTRAASRAQIADMSPMTWLASYGPVVVGRPN